MSLKKWIKFIIENKGKKLGEINFVFSSDDYVIEINKKYLKHNFFTDIITFNYNNSNVINGDIFISIDTVEKNAKIYNVSFEVEIHRVIIHGVLHLLGFDDKLEYQQKIMKLEEDRCLSFFDSKSFLKTKNS